MPRVLAVSPHLDDAAFSCGGLLAVLADRGWTTALVTCFTASVPPPLTPFALSTQTDKGLPEDVDYMALRRAEDDRAAAALGVHEVHRLPLAEAPHRGYTSAPDLFAGVHEGDDADRDVAALLSPLAAGADLLLAPQALGGHADHELVRRAVAGLPGRPPVAWYRDTPYALRLPAAPPGPGDVAVDVAEGLPRKLAACAAYATQLGFQFGGEPTMREALAGFARAEAERCGVGGACEVLRAEEPALLR